MSFKTPTHRELLHFLTRVLGFVKKESGHRSGSSHEYYEGHHLGQRRVVTLDKNHDSFPPRVQKNNVASMVRQMGYANKHDPRVKEAFERM